MFIETHQDPDAAPCEGPTMIPLKALPPLLESLIALDRVAKPPTAPIAPAERG
jgi:2-dehydro-3-deoxyphosphooctonate aldolase (KDO 8-P synthase)